MKMPENTANGGGDPVVERLTSGQLAVLDLLSQGHTAKSIAQLIGKSEAAVNEILRGARRATGVGSSRELARYVAARKFRNEEIGMASSDAPAASRCSLEPSRPTNSASRKDQPVATGISAFAAMLLLQATPPEQSSPKAEAADPIALAAPREGPSLTRLHRQVRAERRDQDWAEPTEAELRTRYSGILAADVLQGPVRVTCGSSLCEVAGVVQPFRDQGKLDTAMEALQGSLAEQFETALGLHRTIISFGQRSTSPAPMVFLAYLKRAHR